MLPLWQRVYVCVYVYVCDLLFREKKKKKKKKKKRDKVNEKRYPKRIQWSKCNWIPFT